MYIIGWLLIVIGFVDFGLSLTGVELYGELGIRLPDIISGYSPVIAGGLGGVLIWIKTYESKSEEIEEGLNEGEIILKKGRVNSGKSLSKQSEWILTLTNQRFMMVSLDEENNVLIPVHELSNIMSGFFSFTVNNKNGSSYRIFPGPWAIKSWNEAFSKVISHQST
jgi:hypothetical protein